MPQTDLTQGEQVFGLGYDDAHNPGACTLNYVGLLVPPTPTGLDCVVMDGPVVTLSNLKLLYKCATDVPLSPMNLKPPQQETDDE